MRKKKEEIKASKKEKRHENEKRGKRLPVEKRRENEKRGKKGFQSFSENAVTRSHQKPFGALKRNKSI